MRKQHGVRDVPVQLFLTQSLDAQRHMLPWHRVYLNLLQARLPANPPQLGPLQLRAGRKGNDRQASMVHLPEHEAQRKSETLTAWRPMPRG